MSLSLRRALLAVVVVVATLVASPASAQDDEEIVDGRFVGFEENVVLEEGTPALNYILAAVLAMLVVGVTFLKSKRSHLD